MFCHIQLFNQKSQLSTFFSFAKIVVKESVNKNSTSASVAALESLEERRSKRSAQKNCKERRSWVASKQPQTNQEFCTSVITSLSCFSVGFHKDAAEDEKNIYLIFFYTLGCCMPFFLHANFVWLSATTVQPMLHVPEQFPSRAELRFFVGI